MGEGRGAGWGRGDGRANKSGLTYVRRGGKVAGGSPISQAAIICAEGGRGQGEGEERGRRATFAPCRREAGDTLYQKHDRMIRMVSGNHGQWCEGVIVCLVFLDDARPQNNSNVISSNNFSQT